MWDWHDWWRLLNIAICTWCLIMLFVRYREGRPDWNDKTIDHFYALTLWVVAGFALSLEGILRDSDFGIRLWFVSVAAIMTIRAILQRGSWGGA